MEGESQQIQRSDHTQRIMRANPVAVFRGSCEKVRVLFFGLCGIIHNVTEILDGWSAGVGDREGEPFALH